VDNVAASFATDNSFKLWDLNAGKERSTVLGIPEAMYNFDYNYDESLICSIAKDQVLRILDPREGSIVGAAQAYNGVKPARITWLGESSKVLTTGFAKSSERIISQ